MTNAALNPSGVRRRLVPLLAAATVLAVLLGGSYAIRRSSSGSPAGAAAAPTVLRLADYQAPAADASIKNGSVDGTFRLAGNLPTGPDKAAVRWLTTPDSTEIERLAGALGMRGRLTRSGGATTYRTGSASLRVQQGAGGSWQYSRVVFAEDSLRCPPQPGPEDANASVSCAMPMPPVADGTVSSGSLPTVSSPPGGGTGQKFVVTTADQARAAARPVLEAVGINPDDALVRAGQQLGIVVGNPTVEQLPTDGIATSVTVTGKRVEAAGGWLGGSRAGATYPVISARAAWDHLLRTPMPRPLMACPEPMPTGSDPMICGGPVTVTLATFGLSLHQADGRWLLVPSWLFEVRGSDAPLPVVAVDPRFLAAPRMTGGGSNGSGGSGSSTGSPGTMVPPDAPAPPGASGPATTDSRFSSVTADHSPHGLLVQFTGGVAACFSYQVGVAETDRQVSLSLVEKATTPDKPCVEMAQVYERKVPLAAPLGTRQVVDAATGAVLLGPSR